MKMTPPLLPPGGYMLLQHVYQIDTSHTLLSLCTSKQTLQLI